MSTKSPDQEMGDTWGLNEPLDGLVVNVSSLYPFQIEWSRDNLYAKPVNDGNPTDIPDEVGVGKPPLKTGMYMYIVVKKDNTSPSMLLWTRVYSTLEYKTKHANLIIWAKNRFKHGIFQMGGEMQKHGRQHGSLLQVNAYSGSYVADWWTNDIPKEQQQLIKQKVISLCGGGNVEFVDGAFTAPPISISRFNQVAKQVGGFELFKNTAQYDAFVRLKSKIRVSRARMTRFAKNISHKKKKMAMTAREKVQTEKNKQVELEKKMSKLRIGIAMSSRDIPKKQ